MYTYILNTHVFWTRPNHMCPIAWRCFNYNALQQNCNNIATKLEGVASTTQRAGGTTDVTSLTGDYEAATISKLLKTIGLFYKRAL